MSPFHGNRYLDDFYTLLFCRRWKYRRVRIRITTPMWTSLLTSLSRRASMQCGLVGVMPPKTQSSQTG